MSGLLAHGKVALAAQLLERSRLAVLLRRLPVWRGVLVLNYHRIGDLRSSLFHVDLWSATPEAFDAQLSFLAANADVIAPLELPEAARATRGRHVLLTFDDGYRDNHEFALPILRGHEVKAAFFLTTGFLDRVATAWWDELSWMVRSSRLDALPASSWLPEPFPLSGEGGPETLDILTRLAKSLPPAQIEPFLDHLAEATASGRLPAEQSSGVWMTWDMARELRDAGMVLGGHTVTHPNLQRLDVSEQEREIAACKARLEAELGEPMRLFSYPYGAPDAYGPATQEILARHRVELAFGFHGGFVRPGRLASHDIPRTAVWDGMGTHRFRAVFTLPQLFARS